MVVFPFKSAFGIGSKVSVDIHDVNELGIDEFFDAEAEEFAAVWICWSSMLLSYSFFCCLNVNYGINFVRKSNSTAMVGSIITYYFSH